MAVDPEFTQLWHRVQNNAFSDHAKQIGLMCIMWGHLEAALDILLHDLLACPDERSGRIIVNLMDMRDKIAAIRAAAFARSPDSNWYKELDACLKVVDETIRPRRNRYIHDIYWPVETGMTKIQRQAKVVNEQSRVKALRLADTSPVPSSQITACTFMILAETQKLRDLRGQIEQMHMPSQDTPA